MVFPSRPTCSSETGVITDTVGVMTLVESSRPPRPTSITAAIGLNRGEPVEGKRCPDIEEGETRFASDSGAETLDMLHHRLAGDHDAIHPDALAECNEMRRCVEASAQARQRERPCGHGRDSTLAVGPGDMDVASDCVRIPKLIQE